MSVATQFDAIIIGAGIGGFVCAWRLVQVGQRVLILDSANESGGVFQSKRVSGYLLEYGPNSFSSSPVVLQLLDELNLTNQAHILPMKNHDRFIWRAGKLRRVPISPAQFLISDILNLRDKIQLTRGLFQHRPVLQGDIELGRYFRQRIGDAAVDGILKPAIGGIYAADADGISFESTFPRLFCPAKIHHSLMEILRAMKFATKESLSPTSPRQLRSLISFDEGVSVLTNTLANAITAAGGAIRLGVRVTASLDNPKDGVWQISDGNHPAARTRNLVIATPACAAAQLLDTVLPSASEALRSIEHAPMLIVHIGLREDQLSERRQGFGYLTVRGQGVRALGIIWSDRVFPRRAPTGNRLLTCFYGGEIDPHAMCMTDLEIQSQVENDLRITMGFQGGDFDLFRITRWKQAIPIFRVGHRSRMNELISQLPMGMHLLGNFTGGVSIPDRVTAATKLAQQLIDK